ncbi:MAG: hypothetical protein Q4B28_05685 [bacterium]|nr:hypothetical protein [bacterium]
MVEIPTSPEYQRLLDTLGERLPEYEGLNDPRSKRLYVPFVVFVKDGVILADHLSTLDEQVDPAIPLTAEQKLKLTTMLTSKMMPLLGATCSISHTPSESC